MAQSFLAQSFFIPKPTLTEANLPSQTGKVHIVTGGYSGVGHELAAILYEKGAVVYIAGRSKEKADKSIETIQSQHPKSSGRLEFLSVDLSDLTTIKKAVDEFSAKEKRLDVLVNNAGVMFPPDGSKGKQGHELQMVTNCLGPFLLTQGLMPILRATAATSPKASVRVVWASSVGTNLYSPPNGVSLDAEGNAEALSNNQTNYGATKAGNNFYAAEFHRRYGSEGILSVAFNPGNLDTDLTRHGNMALKLTAKLITHKAIYGAYTELYSGWSPELTMEHGGAFIIPWGRIGDDLLRQDVKKALKDGEDGQDSVAKRFWAWSEKETAAYA